MRTRIIGATAVAAAAATAVGLTGGVFRATAASPATQTVAAVADSYVSQKVPKTNWGTKTAMRIGEAPTQRGYVRFIVAGISGAVTRATLRLYANAASPVGLSVRGVADNTWGETTITYNNAPPVSATVTASSGSIVTGWVPLDVTSLVAGNGTYSFALTSTTTATAISLATREAGTAKAPQLVVESTVPDSPPANTSPPAINGEAVQGQTLTATPGTWSGTQPISYAYQWRRCDTAGDACGDIAGASTDTYVVAADDVGSTIRVAVSGSNSVGSATAESGPTARVVVAPAPPANTSSPTIAGTAEAGQTLTADRGTWSGTEPIGYGYQWRRCDSGGAACVDITGAAAPTYVVAAADTGSTLRVVVTASNSAGSSAATSGQTAVVGAAPASVVVAAAGDICASTTDCAPTADLLDSIAPTRVLALGDNAYPDGALAQYTNYYAPNWGRQKARTSPAPGNHDYQTPGASGYFDYFGAQAPAAYYSFDLGSWHLISLNGEISVSAGSAQETWLKNDLAVHAGQCILAYWHEPRFSSGSVHGSATRFDAFWRDFYAAGADIVLNGHEHNYERFAPQNPDGVADPKGIREFVVGTGGAKQGSYPFGTPLANSEVRNTGTAGVLKLTLYATGYDWKFVPVAGATFTDAGSDSCDRAGDTTPPTAPTNLAATMSGSQVNLTWTAATDNVGVVAYDIYRNSALLGASTTTSFTDTTVAGATTYDYVVKARDAAANVSPPSNTATVTTPTPTGVTTVTFAPVADARVEQANSATNYGTSTQLRVDGGTDPGVESDLLFDVTGVSGTVQSAKLRVYAYSGTVAGPSVYGSETAWTERGVTWDTRPTRTTAASDTKGAIAANSWVEWNVTPLVTGAGTYSFTLVGPSTDGVDFYSREATASRPELVITFG